MKKYGLMVLGIILSVACASAPAPRQIQNVWQIGQPSDVVWQAALEVLPEMSITIAQAQKDSELITTNPLDLPMRSRTYCDWGKLTFSQSQKGLQGQFTVYVKKVGDAQTELKMLAVYEIFFDDSMDRAVDRTDRTLYKRPCISTGKMEADFYNRIQAKLK